MSNKNKVVSNKSKIKSKEIKYQISPVKNHGFTIKSQSHIKMRYSKKNNEVWDARKEKYIVSYLDKLIKAMRLSDWSIIVEFSKKDRNVFATLEQQPDQKRAILTLSQKFLELDSEDQRQTLVHEMIHCHLFNLHYQVEESFRVVATGKNQELFEVMLESEIEKATDGLADAFAHFLPDFKLP